MPAHLKVALIFGGESSEHEVSLLSAKNVLAALRKLQYQVTLIGISKKGRFYLIKDKNFLQKHKVVSDQGEEAEISWKLGQKGYFFVGPRKKPLKIDVVFPVLHGPFGEDGTLQGLLEMAHLPFVGSGVAGSAIGMDKDVAKRLLDQAHLPVAKFIVLDKNYSDKVLLSEVRRKLGWPIFVKPARQGSSVGVSRVAKTSDFQKALKRAFRYDRKIIIEEAVKGREIECAVLGGDPPRASLPGEIIPLKGFYSYAAKYHDKQGAVLQVPARLPSAMQKKVQKLALRVFEVLGSADLARVDFFLTTRGKLIVNEINTLPGFTAISMYPRLWQISGLSYTALVKRLLRLASAKNSLRSKF